MGVTAAMAGGNLAGASDTGERPAASDPRAISADPVEPKWESRINVTVGPEKADLVGSDARVIQAAVDYVARWGGGTVRILPGTYRCRNAVFLQSGVRLVGSGPESVLIKEPSRTSKLARDVDFYEQEVTLADPTGFQVGDGVCLRARSQRYNEVVSFTRSLIARSGNRFKLDRPLPGYPAYVDLWLKGEPTATSLFALLNGEGVKDVAVEDLVLDGNKANNEFLNGNHVGCIFLRESNRVTMRRVAARNFNGDGVSWQTSHDVVVEDCHCHDNEGFGLHPGSGAQRPIVRRGKLERNDIGFFFCWGVRHGLVENAVISENRRYGVSIGHSDTDNVVRRNDIVKSGEVGILVRTVEDRVFSPNRNTLEENRIIDSGGETGVGVDLQGESESVAVLRNTIRETRQPLQRIGMRIAADSRDVKLAGNRIDGFSVPILDQRRNVR